jgi:hypothetical protein
MAMAGGKVASGPSGNDDAFESRGGSVVGAIFPPTRVTVLRKSNRDQVPIAVNLRRAMRDPQERIRILPGDFIILEYSPLAMAGNIAVGMFRVNWLVGNRSY